MRTLKKRLAIDDIQTGMIVAKEIRHNDKILMNQGVPITEAAIRKLRDYYFIKEVEVFYVEELIEDEFYKERKKIQEVDKEFKELSFDVEKIYDNMESLRVTGIGEVREFAKKIQVELESASAVIKNIVLYGSGKDTIYRHGVNVSALCSIFGKWVGLNENEINLLTYSAVLHDFGKTKIDKNILDKPGSLTEREFKTIKAHPVIGYGYIKDIPFLNKIVSYTVLTHHEKLDGTGYPLGLKGSAIHKFSKILAIVDIFDAVNSNRIYKNCKGPFEALEVIQKESLGRLDYEYCNIFLNHISNYYIGEKVMLNTGKICKIVQIDINDIGRPLLFDNDKFINLKEHNELHIDKLVL